MEHLNTNCGGPLTAEEAIAKEQRHIDAIRKLDPNEVRPGYRITVQQDIEFSEKQIARLQAEIADKAQNNPEMGR